MNSSLEDACTLVECTEKINSLDLRIKELNQDRMVLSNRQRAAENALGKKVGLNKGERVWVVDGWAVHATFDVERRLPFIIAIEIETD